VVAIVFGGGNGGPEENHRPVEQMTKKTHVCKHEHMLAQTAEIVSSESEFDLQLPMQLVPITKESFHLIFQEVFFPQNISIVCTKDFCHLRTDDERLYYKLHFVSLSCFSMATKV
jgi:hypothetical protein